MTRSMLFVSSSLVVAVGSVVSVVLLVPNGPRVVGILAAVGGGVWAFAATFRCRHPSPALLPPTTALDGSRSSAKWCCHECGKVWEARFERDTRPIQRFSGHDESKAVASARRADHLSTQQRGLAIRRSGVASAPRRVAPRRVAQPVLGPVAITRGHRMAK